jgi:ribonuclease R
MRDFPSPAEVLAVFEQHPHKTFRLRDLVLELGLRSSQARDLKHVLKELSRRHQLERSKKNHFSLAVRPGRAIGPSRETANDRPSDGAGGKRSTVTGRFVGHRDGYGFVVTDQPVAGTDQDIFIPPGSTASALHGDRVEVHLTKTPREIKAAQARNAPRGGRGRSERPMRLEGRLIRVLERAQKTIVGEFRLGGRYNYVTPFDHRIPFDIVIPRGQEWPLEQPGAATRHRQFGGESEGIRRSPGRREAARELEGLTVDVEVTDFPALMGRSIAGLPRGRVIEVLGQREDFGVDVEIIIRKYHLPHRFPSQVLTEAEATPQFISEAERAARQDFRGFQIVTIDGETAKDFDDAVHVEQFAGRYRLQVHIADVAHYVRPGMALDREARLRGTSVYFPDRAVPMLPLELSNGICSLNPQVDRLCMSVLMEIDRTGEVAAYSVTPGIMRSAERMTYSAVAAVLAGDAAMCERYRTQAAHFKLMEELARILNERRNARGSIDFDLPEPEIEFDEQGRMIAVTRSERNIAHRIIEEFMLAANETVAAYLEQEGVASLYRVHEKPDPRKVMEFEEIAATFGYSLGAIMPSARRTKVKRRDERERYPRFEERVDAEGVEVTSRDYQRLTQRLAGKPEERILSYLMLRSLKQARYSEENAGHFALASSTYTHFTSPIRRYPDLIVHRILKAVLARHGGRANVIPAGTALESPRHVSGFGVSARPEPAAPRRHPRPCDERREGVTLHGSSPANPAIAGGAFVSSEELQALAVETSEAERRAADAERELMEWKKINFMAGRLGDHFAALIISLNKDGLFIELTDLFVEGFVPLESLADERYIYRERERAVVGERSRRAYRLGDRVTVQLDRIDRVGNRLQFSIVQVRP